jgi:hypothetical protein
LKVRPIHDWTKVRAGTFHHFHQRWIGAIGDALNSGLLPEGYFALAEQRTRGPEPDVVTLKVPGTAAPPNGASGIAAATLAPKTRFRMESDAANYARRADRIAIRHNDGDLVGIIEIVSPGNKSSRFGFRSFVRKAIEFLNAGVHLLIVDLFPPSLRDPQGIHKAIWDCVEDVPFELPTDKPLTLASYVAGATFVAHVEPVAVGDQLPDMPIFLTEERYIPCPLESTYQTTWGVFPKALKGPLESSLV